MTEQKLTEKQLTQKIALVTDFCWKRSNQWTMAGLQVWDKAFNFVAFCMMSGKCAVLWKNDEVKGVIFYWPDFIEHIEAKAENNRPQFEWEHPKMGDAVFVGDVFGNRETIGCMIGTFIQQFPHLLDTPIYTYRKGNLKKLNAKTLNRFTI